MGLKLNSGAAPSTPAAGKVELYFGTDKRLRAVFDDGRVELISGEVTENLLINSSFRYAQRQAPGTLTTYSNTTGRSFGADRWGMTNENASIQFQRVDTSGGAETGLLSQFYGKFKKITNAGKIIVSHVVESQEAISLRGRAVRVQLKAKYSVASSMTIRIGLLALTSGADSPPATFVSAFGAASTDPTWGTNLTALTPTTPDGGTVVGNGVTCVLTNAWGRYGGVFTVPTNALNVIIVVFSNAQLAANDEMNLAEVVLLPDQGITDWQPVNDGLELLRCQRYYSKSFPVDSAPIQNASGSGINGCEERWIAVAAGAVTLRSHFLKYPVRQRSNGNPTLYNPAAANALVRDMTLGGDTSATAIIANDNNGFSVSTTGNASTAIGNQLGVNWSKDSEI